MTNMNLKRNRIVIGWLFLTLLFLVPSVALADVVSINDPGAALEDTGDRIFVISFDVTTGSNVTVNYTVGGDVDGSDHTL